mgnify:CR=1
MKENQTICQFLGVTVSSDAPFTIKNDKGHIIYKEYNDGDWFRYEFDVNGNVVFRINSVGFWVKAEYDEHRIQIYYENSKGIVRDRRPKPKVELTLQQIADKFEIVIEQLTIVK